MSSVMRRIRLWSAGLLVVFVMGQALPALAQEALAEPPPVRSFVDKNGVDLRTGQFRVSVQELSIGNPDAGGLAFTRSFVHTGWRDNYTGAINSSGSTYTVSFGGQSETFTLSNGVYTPNEGQASTLTYNTSTGIYTYTRGDGTIAVFDHSLSSDLPVNSNEGKIVSLTYPSGEKLTFTYAETDLCLPDGTGYCEYYHEARVQSVTNNLGYHLKFEYESDIASQYSELGVWTNLIKVTAINGSIDYCATTALSCTGLTQTWPSITYAVPADNSSARTATDTLQRVTRYTYSSSHITAIRRPSSSTDNITLTYDGAGRVASVSNGVGTWTYVYSDSNGIRTTTVTDPLSHTRVVTTNLSTNLVASDKDGVNQTTSYQYDSYGRRTRVTHPEGDYVQVTYDARGNVTQLTQVAKPGSGLANITTSASYDTTCSNPKTCNEPNSTIDARGNQTDYTYDATHGVLLTVTLPAPTTGAVRPQIRYGYTALYAWYKNSSGTIVQASPSVYLLTSTSQCATTSSCAGVADEVKTTIGYGATGVANNLLPVTVTKKSGDGTLSAATTVSYDSVGNLLTQNGPLAGTTDTTRYRYDDARQLVGVVGPDPDGAGALKNRAQRITYNLDGQPTLLELGTVNSQSDTDWSAISVIQQMTTAYDAQGRKIKETLVSGGATQAVSQFSYDNADRLDCSAVRMNPSVFGSLPASACTLGATGSNGPDRIAKNTWDAADRLTKVTMAYGTAAAYDEVTKTYTANGQIWTLADGKGNLTTNEYDGFDRLSKVRFPVPSGTGSSTTDYEQYTYDAATNITQDRRRDGQTVTFVYDNLNRMTTGVGGVTYAYDNLNRPTAATLTGQTVSYVWDALSRQTSTTAPNGVVSYQYDLAGRRTRTTWPDSYYVTYDWNLANEMTAVRENGATSGVGVLASFAYDDLGHRTSLTRGNGVVTSYAYDAASRLQTLTHNLAGTASDQTLSFTYNAASEALTNGGTNAAYDYPAPSASSQSYTLNGRNQVTAVGSQSLTWDARGNLSNDGAKTYGYDVANRLTSVTGATLAYDAIGRLSQTVSGSVTTKFLYDGADLIGEYSSAGVLLRRYVRGPGADEPLVWYEGSGVTDRRWLVADRLGSIVAVTDGTGASTAINTYDEYGLPGLSNSGRFQYTGQAWIPEIELYHYKARAYSPTLGRFLQTDPIGYDNGMNLYAYVGNDPVNGVDPMGLTTTDPSPGTTTVTEVVVVARLMGSGVVAAWSTGRPLTWLRPSFGSFGASLLDNSQMELACNVVNRGATLQVGLGGQATLGVFSYQGAIGVAIDSSGNVAVYASGGLGGGVGGGGDVGVTVQTTNAPTVRDLGGPFVNASGGGGALGGGTADAASGVARNGQPIIGGGATAGAAAGETSFVGPTGTALSPSVNLFGKRTC